MRRYLRVVVLVIVVTISVGAYAYSDNKFSGTFSGSPHLQPRDYLPYTHAKSSSDYNDRLNWDDEDNSGGIFTKYLVLSESQMLSLTDQLNLDGISNFKNNSLIMAGIDGYWHCSRYFYVGGVAALGYTETGGQEKKASLMMEYAGIEPMIVLPIAVDEVNMFFSTMVGLGKMEFMSDKNLLSKVFWIAEPRTGLQFNISHMFALRLSASYMITEDISSNRKGNLARADFAEVFNLRNMAYAVTFEWGSF